MQTAITKCERYAVTADHALANIHLDLGPKFLIAIPPRGHREDGHSRIWIDADAADLGELAQILRRAADQLDARAS